MISIHIYIYRSKMVHLEKLRVKVKSECDIMDNEDNYLQVN